ncbi:uncharacterized protein LOC108025085 [Drosophila biarmipes]|uniref:uncharacterized protein LOC108025085 n=1 Tax=Drosophila biarmipes TaxID=125945 RepID=UPI0007E7FBC8|nr:uncharacterized protein LOC108025085 [Drosophila biarmipes]
MENLNSGLTQRTWRRILDRLAPMRGCEVAQRDISWYRGLSQSQMGAANRLSDLLRGNMDKKTTSEVAKLMVRLGLHPAPPRKALRQVIELSRGNDLAFLWFLMEMCYKTPNHGETYSVNEQILMSTIFRLDLFPTLRELDRWLPLPHSSQSDREKSEILRQRSQRLRREKEEERQQELARRAKLTTPLSPYFQEPTIARETRHDRRMLSDQPDTPAFLFDMDEEPIETGLWSRWFGSYTLNEAQRVGKSIIFQEINSIFESFKAASLPPQDVESLCTHHQYIREMERSLKIQLERMKQRKCQELLEVRNRLEERRRKQVIQDLEEMSACYLKRFQEMAARARLASTRKQLFGGDSKKSFNFDMPRNGTKCEDFEEERCQTIEADRSSEVPRTKRRSRKSSRSSSVRRLPSGAESKTRTSSRSRSRSTSRGRRKMSKRVSDKKFQILQPSPRKGKNEFEDIMVKLLKGERPILPGCPDFQPEPVKCAKCHIYDPQEGLPQERVPKHRPSSLMQFLQLCVIEEDEEEDLDPKREPNPSPPPAQEPRILRMGLPGTNSFKFNYRELFGSLHRTHLNDERMRLKEAFVRAIDDDVQYLSAALDGEEEGSLDALVDRAAKRLFAEDVKTFHKELEKLQRKRDAEISKENHSDRLNFGQEFYDPENIPLMKEMLRLGLEKVAQDKRYVLPTLPDVHSVPYLVEWIRLRYGKRYSYREKEAILSKDKVVMDQVAWLMRTKLVNIPSLPGGNSINNLAKLRKISQVHREHHTNRFLEAIMEAERVFYAAMKPQLCNLATESTFLAYLPSHYHDLGFTVNTQNGEMDVFH